MWLMLFGGYLYKADTVIIELSEYINNNSHWMDTAKVLELSSCILIIFPVSNS